MTCETDMDNEYGQYVDLETVDYQHKETFQKQEYTNNYKYTYDNKLPNVGYFVYVIHVVWWVGIVCVMYTTIFR